MTTVVLGAITVIAALTLLGVLWSIGRALRDESASARLRREGVRATGTVVDNTMSSTPQRRLVFSPVVEFRSMSGQQVNAPAQQTAARSWPRGTTVEVVYDPDDPGRFVLAGAPSHGHVVANAIVGVLVVGILLGTIVVMHRVWWQFRYDLGTPRPTSVQPTGMQPTSMQPVDPGPWHATAG